MDDIKLKKKKLRQELLNTRRMMSQEDVAVKSNLICKQIMDSVDYKTCDQLFCYYPIGHEVDILSLVHKAFKDNKIVCFPKVINKTTMKFYEVLSLDAFEKSDLHLMEPMSRVEISIDKQTLMIVPGLGFDDNKYRIGYGGGYYDRYINETFTDTNKLTTYGVFYNWQKINELPINKFDKSLSCIKTEQ